MVANILVMCVAIWTVRINMIGRMRNDLYCSNTSPESLRGNRSWTPRKPQNGPVSQRQDIFAAPEAEDATPAYRNTTWETDLSEEPEVLSGTIQHMSGVDGPRSFVTYHFFDTGLVVPN